MTPPGRRSAGTARPVSSAAGPTGPNTADPSSASGDSSPNAAASGPVPLTGRPCRIRAVSSLMTSWAAASDTRASSDRMACRSTAKAANTVSPQSARRSAADAGTAAPSEETAKWIDGNVYTING